MTRIVFGALKAVLRAAVQDWLPTPSVKPSGPERVRSVTSTSTQRGSDQAFRGATGAGVVPFASNAS